MNCTSHLPGGWRLFFRYLVSYLLIFIIPLLLGGALYYQITQVIRQDTIETHLAMLEQASLVVEMRLRELERMVSELNNDPEIQRQLALAGGLDSMGLDSLVRSRNDLPNFALNNELVQGYYLYFQKSDYIRTRATTFLYPQKAYDAFFHVEGYTSQQWHKQLLNTYHNRTVLPARRVFFEGGYDTRIPYLRSLYSMYTGEFLGQAVFLLDEGGIRDLLRLRTEVPGSFVGVLDGEGTVIFSNREEIDNPFAYLPQDSKDGYISVYVSGEEMLFSYVHSPGYGWIYVSAVPVNALMMRVGYIKTIMMVYALAVMTLGATFSGVFAYKNSQPVRKLIRQLVPMAAAGRRDEFEMLTGAVRNLLADREQMQENLLRKKQLLRETFLGGLVHGEFHDAGDMEELMEHTELQIAGDHFAGVLMTIERKEASEQNDPLDALDQSRLIIERFLDGVPDQTIALYYTTLAPDCMAILVGLHQGATAAGYLRRFRQQLYESFGISVIFYMGNVVASLMEVQRSFAQAQKLYNFRTDRSIPLVEYQDAVRPLAIPRGSEIESTLLTLTLRGDIAAVRAELAGLRKECESGAGLLHVRLLLCNLIGALVSALEYYHEPQAEQLRHELNPILYELPDCLPPEDAFVQIEAIFERLCAYAEQRKKSHNTELAQRILLYLQENYHNADLSLVSIAQEFGITERYLSVFFKEQTGENLSVFLERLRVEQANCLLRVGGRSIEEIAGMVGYARVNTFRRAYKKVMGVSPSAYMTMNS